MNNNAIELFEQDTTVRLPRDFIDTIVTEIGSEKEITPTTTLSTRDALVRYKVISHQNNRYQQL